MMALLHRYLFDHPERLTFCKYVVASVLSLGIDLAVFVALLKAGSPAVVAAALSYSCGILSHWFISSRVVFSLAASNRQAVRNYQKLLFVGSALVGLTITSAVVALGAAIHIPPQYAKGIAIIVSFFATWLLRRNVVFSDRIAVATARFQRALKLRTRP